MRQDHEAMRAAAQKPVSGPASSPALAASGGLEVPGREPARSARQVPPSLPARVEPIPGERDPTTLTHREPGAMGGRFSGDDTPPPDRRTWLDEETAREHRREGGGS